ncbi:hypothetical protein M9Y10_028789 [Tritrichomonas musculus]|uniref:Uncharacterized protein n=1 Tax=Tritrichomonas musculus TaxID=1915356 RepID=A0ABR2KLF4_9EUKA
MSANESAEYTIEIDIDSALCNLDNIQEITFEFVNPSLFNKNMTDDEKNERIVDIDFNELSKEDKSIREISAEINGEDTIIKTSNGFNPSDEIDILQMDENSLDEPPQKAINQIDEQEILETQIEI